MPSADEQPVEHYIVVDNTMEFSGPASAAAGVPTYALAKGMVHTAAKPKRTAAAAARPTREGFVKAARKAQEAASVLFVPPEVHDLWRFREREKPQLPREVYIRPPGPTGGSNSSSAFQVGDYVLWIKTVGLEYSVTQCQIHDISSDGTIHVRVRANGSKEWVTASELMFDITGPFANKRNFYKFTPDPSTGLFHRETVTFDAGAATSHVGLHADALWPPPTLNGKAAISNAF